MEQDPRWTDDSDGEAGQAGAPVAGELGGVGGLLSTHRSYQQRAPEGARCAACGCRTSPSMALRDAGPPRSILYFLLPAVAAPGFGLAGALDAVPAVFFLSALGFLGSRLLLF